MQFIQFVVGAVRVASTRCRDPRSGGDGIEVDVAQRGEKILIRPDQSRPVPSFEQVSGRSQGLVAVACITHGDTLHDSAQRGVIDLQERMQMVGHPAKGVGARAVAADRIGDDIVEDLTVVGRTE